MYKLGMPLGEGLSSGDSEHVHRREYEVLNPDSSRVKLFAGAPHGEPEVFEALVKCLQPPYCLLYILHMPRTDPEEEGRYQSPELSSEEFSSFVHDYRDYLSADGRFDLWAYSPAEQATVVWDHNNYLYGYGPIDRFVEVLRTLRYLPGQVDRVTSRTHVHHYRPELDEHAHLVLERYDWIRSALREGDGI